MKKLRLSLLIFALSCLTMRAQQVRNIILLIPDGCSLATISTARWYQWYVDPDREFLHVDPYLSGTVRTTCSNAPIGDSAPTTSCYMTGFNSLKGWVSTYPVRDAANDIYPMDPSRAYQPLTTLMEAARLLYGKSTGLVCTCEFPHATPADCSAHSYNRGKYEWIIPQQVHNGINVLIGGGAGLLPDECAQYLRERGYGVFRNDIKAMRQFGGDNMWALYGRTEMDYDIDRNPAQQPGLDEMTRIAIEKLSHNPKGFFLMVEGSKVDFAAHNNDPIAMVTDYLAFDRACQVAFEFARRDGNTAVIVVPDHGNSGISIGRRDQGDYASRSKEQLFGPLSHYKASAVELARVVNQTPHEQVQSVFEEYCGFRLNEKEMEVLCNCNEYAQSPIPREKRRRVEGTLYNSGLSRMLAQFMTQRTGIAFTTNGHTGEDVFLACYHPQPQHTAHGMLTNVQLNHYMCRLLGNEHAVLDSLTAANFAAHREVLSDYKCSLNETTFRGCKTTALNVSGTCRNHRNGRNITFMLTAYAGTNHAELTLGKASPISIDLPTVMVFVDKTETFYLPRNIISLAFEAAR